MGRNISTSEPLWRMEYAAAGRPGSGPEERHFIWETSETSFRWQRACGRIRCFKRPEAEFTPGQREIQGCGKAASPMVVRVGDEICEDRGFGLSES